MKAENQTNGSVQRVYINVFIFYKQ